MTEAEIAVLNKIISFRNTIGIMDRKINGGVICPDKDSPMEILDYAISIFYNHCKFTEDDNQYYWKLESDENIKAEDRFKLLCDADSGKKLTDKEIAILDKAHAAMEEIKKAIIPFIGNTSFSVQTDKTIMLIKEVVAEYK